MKKRKGSLLQRMMAVLLSAVLMTGMVWDVVPMTVFAQESVSRNAGETQESVSGNSAETVEGDIVPEEGTEAAEGTEQETPHPDDGTGQEMPGTGTEEETEPETISGNDAEAKSVAAPQIMMMTAAPVALADLPISGAGWTLDADGRLTIESDTGMEKWTTDRSSCEKSVKSVEISNGVTSINGRAFIECSNMTSVSIPGSVKNIGRAAFYRCRSLSEITIPEGVTSIGEMAFVECESLERISIPESMEDIGSNAFSYCTVLTSITIPKGVTKIGYCSFYSCSSLTEIIMESETPPSLGYSVFYDCKFVTDGTKGIHIPENTAAAYKAAEGWSTYKDNITDGTHDHNWSADWTTSETHHWHECTVQGCTVTDDAVKDGYGAHVYDNDSDTDCNTCGYKRKTVESDTDKAAAAKTVAENALAGITATNATAYEEIVGVINTALSNAGIMGVTVSIDKFIKTEATASAEGHIEGYVQLTCGQAFEGINMNKPIAKLTEGGDNQGGSGGGNTGGSGNSSGNQGDNGESDDPDGSNSGNNGGTGGNSGGNDQNSGSSGSGNGGAGGTSPAPGGSGIEQPRVKQEQEGNIRKEVSVTGESTLDAAVETPLSRLADIVLTETEKQQAADGTDIRIVLDVKDASASVSGADRKIVETALHGSTAKGYTLGQYFDISLYKVIGDSRNIIKETDSRLTVTLSVPDSLKNTDSTRMRIFAVIRVHDGKAEILSDLDSNEDTITIETDRFSTYAVVYQDTAGENGDGVRLSAENGGSQNPVSGKDNEPKTGDAAPTELYATLTMIAGFAYLLLYFTDRRRGMTEETKKELVSRLIRWAKQGGWIRSCLALAAVFVLLVYYHSIGKKTCAEWKEIYGE